jgi:hypothetical protein
VCARASTRLWLTPHGVAPVLPSQPGERYGTRSQIGLAVWRDGRVEFWERFLEPKPGASDALGRAAGAAASGAQQQPGQQQPGPQQPASSTPGVSSSSEPEAGWRCRGAQPAGTSEQRRPREAGGEQGELLVEVGCAHEPGCGGGGPGADAAAGAGGAPTALQPSACGDRGAAAGDGPPPQPSGRTQQQQQGQQQGQQQEEQQQQAQQQLGSDSAAAPRPGPGGLLDGWGVVQHEFHIDLAPATAAV